MFAYPAAIKANTVISWAYTLEPWDAAAWVFRQYSDGKRSQLVWLLSIIEEINQAHVLCV